MSNSYEIPRDCKSVIAESFDLLLPDHRDAIGVIDTDGLTQAVIQKINRDYPSHAVMIYRAAFPYAVHEQISYLIRNSKSTFVDHHRETVAGERQFRKRLAKDKQRRIVSFRDHTGMVVFKERILLTKAELPLVANYYRKQQESAHDVVVWCEETLQQMELLGLGDSAIVGDVLQEQAA